MSHDTNEDIFPVPTFIKKKLVGLLLHGDDLDSLFNKLDYILNTDTDDCVWARKEMTTTMSTTRDGTIDMFFPKLCKQEPPDFVENETARADSSESEFEMVHNRNKFNNSDIKPIIKKSSSPKKLIKDSLCQNKFINTRPSIDFDCNNELSLFHSTAIGKLHENVPLIGEESGINSSKSDLSTDETADSDNGKAYTNKEKNISNTQKLQSQKDMTENNKNPDSSDGESDKLFSFSQKVSSTKKNMSGAHDISDEEIIPASQDFKDRLCLSLGQEDKRSFSDLGVEHLLSSSIASSKSNLGVLKKKSVLNVSNPETPSLDNLETSLLERITKKMIDVRTLPQEDGREFLAMDDLSDEDEVFLIQCPKNVDPASLVGNEICLEGPSSLSLRKDGQTVLYDSFSIADNSGRSVNLILPARDQEEIKLGVLPLAGNILLSEAAEQPELIQPKVEPLRKVEFPKGLQEICAEISRVSDVSMDESTKPAALESGYRKKKKEKKRELIEDTPMELEAPYDEVVGNSTKKKKKKRKRESLEDIFPTNSPTEYDDNLNNLFEKKRSKLDRSTDDDTFCRTTTEHLIESMMKKKKKKKKFQDCENGLGESQHLLLKDIKKELDESEAGYPLELQSEDIVVKKKKKKKHAYEDCENELGESHHLLLKDIKKEFDESEAGYPLELQSEDIVVKKKKKKKHAYEGDNADCFINPTFSESEFSGKHKKKHKKESIG